MSSKRKLTCFPLSQVGVYLRENNQTRLRYEQGSEADEKCDQWFVEQNTADVTEVELLNCTDFPAEVRRRSRISSVRLSHLLQILVEIHAYVGQDTASL